MATPTTNHHLPARYGDTHSGGWHAVFFASFLVVVLVSSPEVRAGDCSWKLPAGQSGDWFAPSNWDVAVPTVSDYSMIFNGGTAKIASPGAVCAVISVGGNSGTGTVVMTGGDLAAGRMYIDGRGLGTFTQSGGAVNVTGGSITLGSLGTGVYNLSGTGQLSAPMETIGWGGKGSFVQSGGTNTTPFLELGEQGGGTGSYTLSGGTLSTGKTWVGHLGHGEFIQSGGTNIISSQLLVPSDNTGTYTLSGGLLSCPSETIGIYGGNGVFTQSNGTNSAGSLGLASDFATYHLNGGLLIVTAISRGTTKAAFNFNGGTLQAAAAFSTALPVGLNNSAGTASFDTGGYNVAFSGSFSGPGRISKVGGGTLTLSGSNTYSGGTTVSGGTLQVANSGALGTGGLTVNGGMLDLNGYSINVSSLGGASGTISDLFATASGTTTLTVNQLVATNFAGTIQNGSRKILALSKTGTGTLTLSGTSTYTGSTKIYQGKLLINGSLASPVTINSGGTLGGSGAITRLLTVNAAGTLAPGNSIGTLTLSGGLTLASGAKLDFELGSTTASDLILMSSSTLSLNNQQFSDFRFTSLDGFGMGVYRLIDAGSISGRLGTNTTGMIGDLPATLSVSGSDLTLTVVPEPSTFVLLGMGALGLLGYAWRRRKT